MKISYVSDIHLEHAADFTLDDSGDVLILCGDIIQAGLLYRPFATKFFKDISTKFTNILYILGNHEFYNGDINDVNLVKKYFKDTNITVLDNETKIIDGVKFIGGTGWTNFHKADPMAMLHAPKTVSDFRKISNGDEQFTVYDWLEKHSEFITMLKKEITTDGINIVCSHHSPHYETISKNYKDKHAANGCYVSDLSKYMDNVDYWFYGHMHEGLDVTYDKCKILTNPRCYPTEKQFYNFKPKHIEIEL
jgi:predicted MPP superfamily phosphohydrolase